MRGSCVEVIFLNVFQYFKLVAEDKSGKNASDERTYTSDNVASDVDYLASSKRLVKEDYVLKDFNKCNNWIDQAVPND